MAESKSDAEATQPAFRRLQGMRLRDEFLCPITHELLREPVCVADGYTYERSAIEKWFKQSSSEMWTSPLSREPYGDKNILSNRTMKKLIQDLINEGGAGLYTHDMYDNSRMIDVRAEKALVLKCIGPPECKDWFQQSFQVTPRGCIGGRKLQQQDVGTRDLVMFKDTTVSRRHFEISLTSSHEYSIRDLGSAGGTYVRVLFGQRRDLHPGMIFLIGKHQFTVASIDDAGDDGISSSSSSSSSNDSAKLESNSHAITQRSIAALVVELEEAVKSNSSEGGAELEKKLMHITSQMNLLAAATPPRDDLGNDHSITPKQTREAKGVLAEGKRDEKQKGLEGAKESLATQQAADEDDGEAKEGGGIVAAGSKAGRGGGGTGSEGDEQASTMVSGKKGASSRKRCIITCCAPEGSPLIGTTFVVGQEGATIGRKPSNKIAIHGYSRPSEPLNIDSAVSAEHARIDINLAIGRFYITDGTSSKPSTNGTWCRLSGPSQESAFTRLEKNMEVLIGTLTRFQVGEAMTISERDVCDETVASAAAAPHVHDEEK